MEVGILPNALMAPPRAVEGLFRYEAAVIFPSDGWIAGTRQSVGCPIVCGFMAKRSVAGESRRGRFFCVYS